MKTAIITVGLGFGDEGKGATVDALCRRLSASGVVRYCGGSQAGHNVQLPDGRGHTFSQFGAGTFAGAWTYLGPRMIVNPTAMVREAARLEELGIDRPFRSLTIHPSALVSTFYHQSWNQMRESARGTGRHGSCGHGIGETRSYWLRHGSDAIVAQDLKNSAVLREKLELLRQRMLIGLQDFAVSIPEAAWKDADPSEIDAGAVADRLLEIGDPLRFAADPPNGETVIFEGAQGVLLDEWHGFHPHTTWSTVTPQHAFEIARQAKAEKVLVIGITRCFATRHGEGPFPTHCPEMTSRFVDPGNPWNPWQGGFRAGLLDLVLLRYAAQAAGPLDGLAVTCLDYVKASKLAYCYTYGPKDDLGAPGPPNLVRQELRNSLLKRVNPTYTEIPFTKLRDLLSSAIAPVVSESRGPTHLDRTWTGIFEEAVEAPSVKNRRVKSNPQD